MEKINLESFNLFIANGGVEIGKLENIVTDFDISSLKFLAYAESDLNAKYEHHLINSLSNTKRAIDSQLDTLLAGFGLSEKAKKWYFPTKIDFLNRIGVISPKILTKINKKRNLLEHEYKNPNNEEVEDALDVAELFIRYTNKYLYPAIVEFNLYDKKMLYDGFPADTNVIIMTLDWRNCKFIFDTPIKDADGKWKHITEDVNAEQKDYENYLKIFLSFYNDVFH